MSDADIAAAADGIDGILAWQQASYEAGRAAVLAHLAGIVEGCTDRDDDNDPDDNDPIRGADLVDAIVSYLAATGVR